MTRYVIIRMMSSLFDICFGGEVGVACCAWLGQPTCNHPVDGGTRRLLMLTSHTRRRSRKRMHENG